MECYLWWRRLLLWRFPCNFIDAMLCALFRGPVSIIASRCSGYFLILITHNHMLVVPKDAQTNHAHPSVYNCPGSCRFPGLNHLICHHTLRNQWPTRQQTAINAPCQMRGSNQRQMRHLTSSSALFSYKYHLFFFACHSHSQPLVRDIRFNECQIGAVQIFHPLL